MSAINEIITLIAPFISGAFGVGLMYGLMRGEIKVLKQEVKDMNVRIIKNEKRLDIGIVDWDRLEMRCNRCHENYTKSLDEIKDNIKETREKLPQRILDILNASIKGKM